MRYRNEGGNAIRSDAGEQNERKGGNPEKNATHDVTRARRAVKRSSDNE